jgi:hypothetical protein
MMPIRSAKKDINHMKKYIIASLILLVLIAVVVALFLSRSKSNKPDLTKSKSTLPVIVNQIVKPSAEVLETDQNTICNSDNDCWCRSFDGTGFQPGKVPSRCNLQTKKCTQCFYE